MSSASSPTSGAVPHPFPGTYVLEGYVLQEDTLRLVKHSPSPVENFQQVFTFADDRRVGLELQTPSGFFRCGNGMMYLEASSYRYHPKKQQLSLRLEGGHLVEDKFSYRARYDVLSEGEGKFLLVRSKVKRLRIKPDGQATPRPPVPPVQEHTPTGLEARAY